MLQLRSQCHFFMNRYRLKLRTNFYFLGRTFLTLQGVETAKQKPNMYARR